MKHKCDGCRYKGEHHEMMFRPFGVCTRNTNLIEAEKAYNAEKCPYKKINGVTIQKWIPVSERLPENREDVLLCRKWWNEIRNPQMGWYNDGGGEWFDLSNRVICNVTHWMPLPEPPKGE